jgi:predicted alpha/beta hydrolase family esterase
MPTNNVLFVHGCYGVDKEGWQKQTGDLLVEAGAHFRLPLLPKPEEPRLIQWRAALDRELEDLTDPNTLTVATHSLGGALILDRARAFKRRVAKRLMIVALMYLDPVLLAEDLPMSVREFYPLLLDAEALATFAGETIMIASENDFYAGSDHTLRMARELGVPVHFVENARHFGPKQGFGQWPLMRDLCLGTVNFEDLELVRPQH